MPNQIEKLITALEEMIEKDALRPEENLVRIVDRGKVCIDIGTSDLLKILHAHKFLLEGVEKVDFPPMNIPQFIREVENSKYDGNSSLTHAFKYIELSNEEWRTQRDDLLKKYNEMI